MTKQALPAPTPVPAAGNCRARRAWRRRADRGHRITVTVHLIVLPTEGGEDQSAK
jgi:hypothetical protein